MRAITVIPLSAAFIFTVVYTAAVPTLAYSAMAAASIASSGDMGGPLNFVLIPAAGLAVGVIGGIFLLLLSPLFHKAARTAFLAPFVIAALTFLLILAWSHSRTHSPAFPIAFSAFVSFWFGSAALLFVVTDMVMRRIVQTITSRKHATEKSSQ